MQQAQTPPLAPLRSRLAAALCPLVMAACGGTGGGDGSPVQAQPLLSLVAGTLDEGGSGSANGTGPAARFRASDLTLGTDGNIYLADVGNATVRKVTPEGVVTTSVGKEGEQARIDGAAGVARFNHPRQIARAPDGSLYVMEFADVFGEPVTLRQIRPDGTVTTLLSFAGASAPGGDPLGPMAIDASGHLYVADHDRCELRRINLARPAVETVASFPGNGACTLGSDVRSDAQRDIYYVEGYDINVRPHVLKKLMSTGAVTTVLTSDHPIRHFAVRTDGAIVFTDGAGLVFISSPAGSAPQRLSGAAQISNYRVSVDGDADSALFDDIRAMVADAANNVLVVEDGVTVRRLDATGRVTTLAGLATQAKLYRTGTGGAARIGYEPGLVADSSGSAYLSGGLLQWSAIAKVTPEGVVTTVAGSRTERGTQDGPGATARFNVIRSLLRDPGGALLVAEARDSGGSCGRYGVTSRSVRRKVDAVGTVSTRAYAFDGDINQFAALADARLLVAGDRYVAPCETLPKAVMVSINGVETVLGPLPRERLFGDGKGNLYFIAGGAIRKRATDGSVMTMAGSEAEYGDSDGTGAAARFRAPGGLDIDAAGNVYVADTGNHTVRKISPAGVVTTVLGRAGLVGIRLGALPGGLDGPTDVAVVPQGLLIRTKLALLRATF